MHRRVALLILFFALATGRALSAPWDNFSDTWAATDGLGRPVPGFNSVGSPRTNRTIGIFYFLWLGPHAQQGGPWDVTKILAKDPHAMQKPDSPLWGPMFAPHHWGESIFGYYNSDDPYVLRKHAQMLSDAGVDVVVFDVTNQLTYKENYMALLRAWSEVRAQGNRTPQVAFLCPFWDPAKVVRELYHDLYQPGIHPDLWFRWRGKPLILADPDKLAQADRTTQRDYPAELKRGETLGQTFRATRPFTGAGGSFPTWHSTKSKMTLRLRRHGPEGEVIAVKRFGQVEDNSRLLLEFPPQQPGAYYLEMSESEAQVGWWSARGDLYPDGEAHADGKPVAGDRNIHLLYSDSDLSEIRNFFTFRRPQPDYFRGQTAPDMWSWLEVFPQHLFTNSLGDKEQMSVGVAQNAVSNRLGSLSEPGSLGRSFHSGKWDSRSGAVNLGLNFTEQFEHALRQDPKFVFITGWNEWIAGRHPEFNGVRLPVMFVDQFDQEHSRDIEPMRGGHNDHYYYQMAGFIRRFKGVRPPPAPTASKTINIERGFDQWNDVAPEYRDDIADTFHRDFPGYANHQRYLNNSGRNDIVAAKVTSDPQRVYFYVRTREALSPASSTNWMWLLIDADNDPKTGWEGYDLIANRKLRPANTSEVERNSGVWQWQSAGTLALKSDRNELHLAIPRELFRAPNSTPLRFNFKWADNVPENGDIASWLDAGDSAPNGRFNYCYVEEQ